MKFQNERTTVTISGWAMFWVFMIMYLMTDTILFTKGYETFYWRHVTAEEKEIQQIKIQKLKETER